MFSIQTETNPLGTIHTVNAATIELASELLEAADRHSYFAETDAADARRVLVFYINDAEMDSLIIEARNAFDNRPLMPMEVMKKAA